MGENDFLKSIETEYVFFRYVILILAVPILSKFLTWLVNAAHDSVQTRGASNAQNQKKAEEGLAAGATATAPTSSSYQSAATAPSASSSYSYESLIEI